MTQIQFDRFVSGCPDLVYGLADDKSYIKFISSNTKRTTIIEMQDFKLMNIFDLYRAIYKGHLLDE